MINQQKQAVPFGTACFVIILRIQLPWSHESR